FVVGSWIHLQLKIIRVIIIRIGNLKVADGQRKGRVFLYAEFRLARDHRRFVFWDDGYLKGKAIAVVITVVHSNFNTKRACKAWVRCDPVSIATVAIT